MSFLDLFKSKPQPYPLAHQPAFRGDLSGSHPTPNGYAPPQYNIDLRDSSDAVVHMTFAAPAENLWFCPECGTFNKQEFDGCVVCGLKK